MAFTATHTSGSNIIINTSSLNVYIFKEPNVNFNVEKITKTVTLSHGKKIKISQDIFQNGFSNKELNDFFGIKKSKSKNSLKFLKNGETKLQTQLFPVALSSSLIDARRRRDFIYEAWRDDPYLTNSSGFSYNILRTREAQSSLQQGFCIPSLSSSRNSLSVWPLDFFTLSDRPGNDSVCGELMWLAGLKDANQNSTYPVASFLPLIQLNYSSSLPFVSPFFANSKPFQDSESEFTKITSKKYKNYSIIPEYNLSSKITAENFENLDYVAEQESFNFYCTGSDYISPITEQININGAIKFDIKSVLQTRPYKEFYPVFASLKAASIFSKTLTQIPAMNEPISGAMSFIKMAIATSPYFGPGVLFNSIKAGIPMQFVGAGGFYRYIFPFKSVFNPLNDLLNKDLDLPNGVELTESVNTLRYQNYINNFLNEVRNTFCKNNSLEYFSSKKEDDYQIFTSGTNYCMDLSLNVGTVQTDNNQFFNWIDGVNTIGTRSFGIDPRLPNFPQYFQSPQVGNETYNGLSCLRISFTPDSTRKYTIDEIFANSNLEFRINKSLTGSTLSNLAYYPKVTSSFDVFEKETDISGTYWKIKSKWEFPFLCLTGTIFTYSAGNFRKNDCLNRNNTEGWIGGLWHDFCEVPSADRGLFLELSDVNYQTASLLNFSASLADMVGFKSEVKRVGEINTNKVVKELVCIVPYKTDGTFFEISENSTLAKLNLKIFKKFILPPKLDHNRDGVSPKMIFCTEISDTWSKRDLAYIWQNLLPQNGLNHKEFDTQYVVDDECNNILKNNNVKFMIFKCKQRSSSSAPATWDGYNWFYDMFSLVELVKVDLVQEM